MINGMICFSILSALFRLLHKIIQSSALYRFRHSADYRNLHFNKYLIFQSVKLTLWNEPLTLWKSSFLISNPEIVQICFIFILCGQTGISQITLFIIPFFQSSVIEHLQIILYDEWNNIIFQAFFEHNQSSYTTVAVLERMDSFKLHMEVQNIFKGLFFLGIVFCQAPLSSYRQLLPEGQISIPPTSFGSFL